MSFFDGLKNLVSKPAPQPVAPVAPSKKVLVVEDDDSLRALYSDIITAEGFAVIKAENGQIGYDLATTQRPDLILLDLMMPVMDGKTMLSHLRQIPEFAKLPVIILTNAGDIESMRETKFYNNASEFLIKANVTPKDIIDKVKAYI